ncbi:MAG: hypothetical protein Q8M39_02375 [Sulfuricurvum sp.]|nr:hypothetical protein [Sulfuricurvum sp.]
MHGKIIIYDNETEIGIIKGEDDGNYTLSIVDCRSVIPPKIDADVNFDPHEDKATEIYVISSEVHHASVHQSSHEQTHPIPKKSPTTLLPLVAISSLLIFIGVLIYGELDRKNIQEIQDRYELQIKKIETLLKSGDCSQAQSEYLRAQETRNKIFKMGLYYSLESHAKQAHAIEIAECYAHENAFNEAIKMLDIHKIHDPDYLLRASIIYKNAGDTLTADEAKLMAEKYDTSMN